MKRNYGIDLMRAFLCLCVIALHSSNYLGINNDVVGSCLTIFLLQADGIFYALSGYFNLEQEFNNSTDIKKYYKHKIIYILFPFLAFLFVWTLWDYAHETESFKILEFLSIYYETFMVKSSRDHMWFLYHLFGMLLATPFLSKMLHNMDEKELKILWRISIGWNVICYYLCLDLGMDFPFLGWIFEGWITYYFAGYYYRHVVAKESKLKWAIIGILCFVLTNVANMNLRTFEGATTFQPMFILFCVSCIMFWDKLFNITNEKIGKICVFLSKNTFMIYLFHMRVMGYLIQKFNIVDENLTNGLFIIFSTFIVSLIVSAIANALMKPVQKFIDKHWVIE